MPEPTMPEMPGAGWDPEVVEVNSGGDLFEVLAVLVSMVQESTTRKERDESLRSLAYAVGLLQRSNLARMPIVMFEPNGGDDA